MEGRVKLKHELTSLASKEGFSSVMLGLMLTGTKRR